MNRCRKVGLDVTRRCNAACRTCFYRFSPDFNKAYDVPFPDIQAQLTAAKARGCNHAVLVGWGETTLYPYLNDLIDYCREIGFTCSLITNGIVSPDKASALYVRGLNHLHLSAHGLGNVLNTIMDTPIASKHQEALKDWLRFSGAPWRANTTLQKENYTTLPDIAEDMVNHGCRHGVLLGFLPHYEWRDRLKEVAVHPADLRPHIEKALDVYIDCNVSTTLRYHPMCHLDPKYWKYVVNARYVLYDPSEWEYGACGKSDTDLWDYAVNSMGGSVAIQGEPCNRCAFFMHCGGWNRVYAAGFDGAGLKAVTEGELPEWFDRSKINTPGYLFDMNPHNAWKGWY